MVHYVSATADRHQGLPIGVTERLVYTACAASAAKKIQVLGLVKNLNKQSHICLQYLLGTQTVDLTKTLVVDHSIPNLDIAPELPWRQDLCIPGHQCTKWKLNIQLRHVKIAMTLLASLNRWSWSREDF